MEKLLTTNTLQDFTIRLDTYYILLRKRVTYKIRGHFSGMECIGSLIFACLRTMLTKIHSNSDCHYIIICSILFREKDGLNSDQTDYATEEKRKQIYLLRPLQMLKSLVRKKS